MIFMSKENMQLYWYFEFKNKKLSFWKDRHLKKLKNLLNKRYDYRNYFMPKLDMQIELQKQLCKIGRR